MVVPVGQGRGMIATIQQGLKDDGFAVSISQLCRWFGVPRRTVYYKPTKAPSKVNPDLAGPIKALIEEEPSFGYRTVAGRSEEHTSELQSLMRISYAVFCSKKNNQQ